MTEPTTRDKIIELAEQLIRTRGYNGFSFKDISAPLGIKNAAVHYHFPSKEDLGVAVLESVSARAQSFLDDPELTSREKLLRFIAFFERSREQGLVCIMGALGPGYDALPENLQAAAKQFAEQGLKRLTDVIRIGEANGEFSLSTSPEARAQSMTAALMSGLLLGRVLGSEIFENIKNEVLNDIKS